MYYVFSPLITLISYNDEETAAAIKPNREREEREAFSVNPGDFPDTQCESLRTNKRGLLEVVVVNEGGIRLTHTSK